MLCEETYQRKNKQKSELDRTQIVMTVIQYVAYIIMVYIYVKYSA